MLNRKFRGWELPGSAATSESVFADRRRLLRTIGNGAIFAAAGPLALAGSGARAAPDDPSGHSYPAPRNPRYPVERAITDEKHANTWINFFEFTGVKWLNPLALWTQTRPWDIRFDGLIETPFTIGVDDLIAKMRLEERVYRFRCVEAWSMTVPWTGFPMRDLVAYAKPLSAAKYMRLETFYNPRWAPIQRLPVYPWPYIEGLTMAEATNELAFVATGLYGKPLLRQNGTPIRLVIPWKYGFKSIKSIVRVTFTDEQPRTFWETVEGGSYGFWANVHPNVPHPRWSQETEELLGTGERVSTQIYNGYGDFVAGLYPNLEDPAYFR